MRTLPRPHRGFTLVEMLVVISISALLLALLMPQLSQARDAAQLVSCQSNQRQTGISMATYSADTNAGMIARPDMGRGNSTVVNAPTGITNDRGVGIPTSAEDGYGSAMHLGLFNQGSWMINGYGSTSTLFCPGLSIDKNTIGSRLVDYKLYFSKFSNYWETAGLGGVKPTQSTPGYTVYSGSTSYLFNNILLGDGQIGTRGATLPGSPDYYSNSGSFLYTEMNRINGASTRLADLKGGYPVMCDERGFGSAGLGRSYHNSTGYNVLRVDGAVRFLTMSNLIEAGSGNQMNGSYRFYFSQFRTKPLLIDPSQDLTAYGVLGSNNPFVDTNSGRFWLYEAMRISMN